MSARPPIPKPGAINVAPAQLSDPAAAWEPITASDSEDLTGLYRALRFDVGGAVVLTVYKSDGTTVDITRTFAAGEQIPASCVKYVKATGTAAGVVVDGWA